MGYLDQDIIYRCLNCDWIGVHRELQFDPRIAGDENIEDMMCPKCLGEVEEME